MQIKTKLLPEKIANFGKKLFQYAFVVMEKYKIIGVADVVFCFEHVLHKLVEFVHVDVHEKLGSEIAQWKAGSKAADDTLQKP